MARLTFACVSVTNLRITKPQQIRAKRRALILASFVPIHLIGEDWEARGERMLFTIPRNCKFISSTYEKYFSHKLVIPILTVKSINPVRLTFYLKSDGHVKEYHTIYWKINLGRNLIR